MAARGGSPPSLAAKLGADRVDRLVLLNGDAWFTVPGLAADRLARVDSVEELTSEELVVAFVREAVEVGPLLSRLARVIFPAGAIWTAWPRRAAGHRSDVTDNLVRAAAVEAGLVDVKVAALGEDWSGLRLVWRLELRDRPPARTSSTRRSQ